MHRIKKTQKRSFSPTEIIFASTTACNLHCAHCFVNRIPRKLEIADAEALLETCAGFIDKVGFSGGEPFLYPEFLFAITKKAVSLDYMFDQITTNGDWWTSENELKATLQKLYEAGYDGKFCLSYDSFHNQTIGRVEIFVGHVQEIFGKGALNIQSVYDDLQSAAKSKKTHASCGFPPEEFIINHPEITVYKMPRSYPATDDRAWQAKKWFKEDFCEGPGHIFYVHADGNIAPCCGFANENPALFIGTIKDEFQTLMRNASGNEMIRTCYETGLSRYKRTVKHQLQEQGKRFKGTCGDICSFCDFVCNMQRTQP